MRFTQFFTSIFSLLILLSPVVAQADDANLIIKNAMLITVAPDAPDAFNGYLAVGSDGRISHIGAGDPPASIKAPKTIDMGGKVIAPGFISAHSHLYMSPLRGLGHDQNLYGWFKAWDYYLRHTTAEDMYWFTLHGSLDFIRNGITTAYDFTNSAAVDRLGDDPSEGVVPAFMKPGPFEENQIQAKIDAGLRFINSPWLSEIGSDEDILTRYDNAFNWSKPLMDDEPLFLKMALSGSQQFSPTKRTAKLEATVMNKYKVINQSHFLESPTEVEEQQKKFDWYLGNL